jgi:hypothetical protein
MIATRNIKQSTVVTSPVNFEGLVFVWTKKAVSRFDGFGGRIMLRNQMQQCPIIPQALQKIPGPRAIVSAEGAVTQNSSA